MKQVALSTYHLILIHPVEEAKRGIPLWLLNYFFSVSPEGGQLEQAIDYFSWRTKRDLPVPIFLLQMDKPVKAVVQSNNMIVTVRLHGLCSYLVRMCNMLQWLGTNSIYLKLFTITRPNTLRSLHTFIIAYISHNALTKC